MLPTLPPDRARGPGYARDRAWSAGRPLVHQVAALEGLALVRTAPDAQLFAVTALTPVVATVDVTGFRP